jgi:hypothetical protein
MRLIRTVAILGVAKKAYDVARRPENQQRIRAAVGRVQEHRARSKKR